jgi:hypothetical protein
MIFALAGRRIDLPHAQPVRFPSRNVALVRGRLDALFARYPGGTLICSAACGADLLALEAAGERGWRRRVVLPFPREKFRETSVADRPGEWSALYDRVLDEVESVGDLIVEFAPQGQDAYAFANDRILEEAGRLAATSGERPTAIVVWDGRDRGPGDLTSGFAAAAAQRASTVLHLSTLE